MAYPLLIVFLSLLSLLHHSLSCLSTHKQSLLQFKSLVTRKNDDNSAPFFAFDSWNTSNCCNWEGVTCNRELPTKPVTKLSLSGVVPLTYTAPSSAIASLFAIKTLTFLDISQNSLEGEIPWKGFENLMNLRYLDLSSNLLNGTIPLTIFKLRHLRHLNLGANSLTGVLASAVADLSSLEFLSIDENFLTGQIPSEIGNLIELKVLSLSQNQFSGELPQHILRLERLQILDLGNASTIMILLLSRNNLTGSIPASITNIYRLLVLDLSENQFSGDSFPQFGPDTYLAYVDLSENGFYGEVPMSFGRQIRSLALSGNKFTGPLPGKLNTMQFIENLDLHDNYITGEMPFWIGQISTISVLNLRNNKLEGPVPHTISNLSKLHVLDLSGNNLSGSIPIQMGHLEGMVDTITYFSISDLFTFSIDLSDITFYWKGALRGLGYQRVSTYANLDLSRNGFSGIIPIELGNLKGLKSLNMSYNMIQGRIPANFGHLGKLESLDLSHNRLNGSIPPSFESLNELTTLDLSYNRLMGRIPDKGKMSSMMDIASYTNNSGLCGIQIRVRCESDNPTKVSDGDLVAEGEEKSEDHWFKWIVVFGFFLGFSGAMTVSYFSGFLYPDPPRRYLRSHRQRR
ncbi:putative LRR receptor-like serine/threonine-protein kinase [Carex littledalei]|uniref:Putative LRR receptor-like serine/threonine-protein kinase n=1 Tax=Carex littledalei TaxID=544730 RepID=A0A833REG9_9POAL|nr:putative LRR receptor-like serine/threonine-protein kinase [Carex littledalei]